MGTICHCYSSGINPEEEGVEMFLNPKILKKLLKEAYKHRSLYLACKTESLYIAAGYWEMEFLKEYIPKETLGDIVALSGMLPEDGQRYQVLESGNQLETGLPLEIKKYVDMRPTEVTNWLTVSSASRMLRVLQDASGETKLLDDTCVKAVDSSYCETEKGETAPATPTYNEWSVVWENNVGKFRVMLHRMDEDKEGVLQQLGMVDLRRNPD